MLKPVAQNVNQTVILHRVFKSPVEFLLRVGAALLFKPLPLDRLGGLDKVQQGAEVQGHIRGHRSPIAGVGRFLPAAGRGNQEGFDVLFKLLFVIGHSCHLLRF